MTFELKIIFSDGEVKEERNVILAEVDEKSIPSSFVTSIFSVNVDVVFGYRFSEVCEGMSFSHSWQ